MKRFKSSLYVLFLSLFIFASCSSHAKTPLSTKDIQHINIINGSATECMMDEFFMYQQNWQKIEGERGANGIDGLYIKTDEETITDVLIAESKYNHARLGSIKKGTIKQMSKSWILEKLKIAKPYNPSIINFDQIISLVKTDNYRARLFKLIPLSQNRLKIILYRIKSQNDNNSIEKLDKSEIIIPFKNPQNSYQSDMIDTYNRCRRESLHRWFPDMSETKIEELLSESALGKEDI